MRHHSPIGTIRETKRPGGTTCQMIKTLAGWKYVAKRSQPGYVNPQKTGRNKKPKTKRKDPNYIDPRTLKSGHTQTKRMRQQNRSNQDVVRTTVLKTNMNRAEKTRNDINPKNITIPVQSGGRWVKVNARTSVYRRVTV